jgi:hypothetical protein
MLKKTPTGSDFKNTRNEDLSAGTRSSILPDRSTTKTTSGWVGSGGKLNFGTRVTMRAEVFGMVGWVSRMAEGEEREAHFIRRTKSVERVVDVWPSWASAYLGLKVLLVWALEECPPR